MLTEPERWALGRLMRASYRLSHIMSKEALSKLTGLGLVSYTRDGANRYNVFITEAGRTWVESNQDKIPT